MVGTIIQDSETFDRLNSSLASPGVTPSSKIDGRWKRRVPTISACSYTSTSKVRSTSTPSYRRRLTQDRQHSHNLQSTTTTLCQPSTTTTFAKRDYRCSAPAVCNSLPKTVLHSDSVAVFESKDIPLFPGLSFLSLLTNTLPGRSASEVTTLWRYTNPCIIIIIIIIIMSTHAG